MVVRGAPGTMSSQTLRRLASFQISLEDLRLRHAVLPAFSAIFSCRLAEFVI
jgi:hypothetical protein